MNNKFFEGFLIAFLLLCIAGVAQATTIHDLYNTGLDSSGNLLASNVADPHYTLISQPNQGTYTAMTVLDDGFPIPPWFSNDTNSQWIGPNTNEAKGPPGFYKFETTFTIGQDADLSNVLVNGSWGTDNRGSIWLNGNDTGDTWDQFKTLTSFSLSSGFVLGTNSLIFQVENLGTDSNPIGLRVAELTGSYSTVPEPATMLLFGIGLLGLAGVSRKRA